MKNLLPIKKFSFTTTTQTLLKFDEMLMMIYGNHISNNLKKKMNLILLEGSEIMISDFFMSSATNYEKIFELVYFFMI